MSKGLYQVVLILALAICVGTGTVGYRIGYREGSKFWENLNTQNDEITVDIQQ